jgi:signal peptidase II
MTGPTGSDGGSDLDQTDAPPAGGAVTKPAGGAVAGPAGRPAWLLFFGVAAVVLIADQLTKVWVVANIIPGTAVPILGEFVRLIHSKNDGALFGLFGTAAPVLAIASIGVLALIVGYHARSGRSPLLSVALGLLLGGATGNLIDRIRLGYVVDWVDGGLGSIRFWTFNVGDAAISLAILLLILLAIVPGLAGDAPGLGSKASDG